MKETTLSMPSSPTSHSSHSCDVQEYQVDNVSTSSCRDSDSDDESEDAIVVASEANIPTIESVSVVNSTDVHIGNKTVYQGPVTIKQIVYPNSALSDCVNNLQTCENRVTVKSNGFPTTDGIDNPTFVKDNSLQKKNNANGDINAVENNDAQHTLTGIGKGIINSKIVNCMLLLTI